MFVYSVGILRAVEEAYETAYANGIELYRKGCLVAHIKNPFSIAEFLCDYEYACKHIGKKPGKRASYKEVQRMCEFLNGKDS